MKQIASPIDDLTKLAELDATRARLDMQGPGVASITVQIENVRERLPTAILKHYDHRRSRGKPGAAKVRNGICGACHLSLPGGQLADLRRARAALHVCAHCGVFILPEDSASDKASPSAGAAPVAKPQPRKRPTSNARSDHPNQRPLFPATRVPTTKPA